MENSTTGNEIWFYYNALRIRDHAELYDTERYGYIDRELFNDLAALSLAKLRLDGFVSLDAGSEGSVVTKPFMTTGGACMSMPSPRKDRCAPRC